MTAAVTTPPELAQLCALEELAPFGVLARARASGTELHTIPASDVQRAVSQYRMLLLRGFAPLTDQDLTDYGRRLGNLLEWEFGLVNELRAKPDAKNYLFTANEVPFHWDGPFVRKIPSYIVFNCIEAPPAGAGGETVLADTTKVLERASAEQRERWSKIEITYSTDKVLYYGGSFTSPMLGAHAKTLAPVLRYAEPVDDLNPVHLTIHGLPSDQHAALIDEMGAILRDPGVCYAHRWEVGDILFADNHALLHGRRAFSRSAPRHLRRVNIL
jgi:alpha-ketoglutarate-dependent taurine dioxygenase